MALHSYYIFFCLFVVVVSQSSLQLNLTKVELEEYIAAKSLTVKPRYRPHFHLAPPVGWMNDPNGFSFYKGEYHLFYQFYPYDTVNGPMHWGHSSSPDLVTWKTLPTALIPDEEQCFSGGAIVVGDTLTLMYTGHKITAEYQYKETQNLAMSNDGINFQKFEGNPVLPTAPNSSPDFRDPKVWKDGDYYFAILGSKTDDGLRGRVLLYGSLDMKSRINLKSFGDTELAANLGYMWECPDFFQLDEYYVFLWSPQGMKAVGDRYKNIYQTGYIIGHFDKTTYDFVPITNFKELDFGHDFYASQTVLNDGKRYQVAWFNTWEKVYPEAVDGWVGMMTIVRELKLHGQTLLMKPVDSMINLRDQIVLNGTLTVNQKIEFNQTAEILIDADLEKKIEILITGRNGGNKVWLKWDPAVRKVVVDRDGDVRQVEWTPIESHTWRLFLDASSLELFCGEGEVVFSSRVYPDGKWDVTSLSSQELDVLAFSLKRSVPGSDPYTGSANSLTCTSVYGILYLVFTYGLLHLI